MVIFSCLANLAFFSLSSDWLSLELAELIFSEYFQHCASIDVVYRVFCCIGGKKSS